jgi:hypothetical protein
LLFTPGQIEREDQIKEVIRGANAVMDVDEQFFTLVFRLDSYIHQVDSGLPPHECFPDFLLNAVDRSKLVHLEYQPVNPAPEIGPHDALIRGSGENDPNGVLDIPLVGAQEDSRALVGYRKPPSST